MRYYIELIHINTLRRRCCRLRRAREHRANNPNSHAVHDFFHRATLCVSAVFAVVRCPSVSLTCWCIVSTRLKISSNFFLDPVGCSHITSCFWLQRQYSIPRRTSSAGTQSTRGWENYAIFGWNRRLSRKRYEIGPWLLWNVNRKSWCDSCHFR